MMTYTLRSVSAQQTAEAAQQWDDMTQRVLERSMGLHPAEQSWERTFTQAGAPYVLQRATLATGAASGATWRPGH